MLVTVQLKASINEALTQYRGCPIVDADEDTVWIAVDSHDVYTNYTVTRDLETYEFWGSLGVHSVGTLDVKECTYEGRKILNADEVVDQIVELWEGTL